MRLFARFRIGVLVAACVMMAVFFVGVAEAANPHVDAWYETHVKFSSEWETDYSTQAFSDLNVRVYGSALSTPGYIQITPSESVDVRYDKAGTYPPAIMGRGTLSAECHTFTTFPELAEPDRYRQHPFDPDKGLVNFVGEKVENGSVTYSVSYTNDSEHESGNIDAPPLSACVPYMELTTSGTICQGGF
jgi:hypothetical protein